LTGQFNRRHMDVVLQHEVGRAIREGEALSMLLIDVDDFKQVNDTRSHVEGDNCLRTVARILLSLTRGTDIACRYGGDEFAVILPRVNEPAALDRAERVRAQVESETGITVSIGAAGLHDDSEIAPEILFSLCDSLLRQAKANGKNQVIGPLTSPLRRPEEWALADPPAPASGRLLRLGPD
jgi:diguanylate cyclase (GGDEF)-like protein